MTRQRPIDLYLQFLLIVFAGWINRHQQAVIECLRATNQALSEQLGNKRIRGTDALRQRLAEKAKAVGRAALAALDSGFAERRNISTARTPIPMCSVSGCTFVITSSECGFAAKCPSVGSSLTALRQTLARNERRST